MVSKVDCGTWASYRAHKRRGQAPCDPCIEAMRERSREQYYRHRERHLAQKAERNRMEREARPSRPVRTATCPVCCGDFETVVHNQKFCSSLCRYRNINPGTRITVLVPREGKRSKGHTGRPWRRLRALVLSEESACWVCGQAIDMELESPHPWSASVDHVVPISQGGAELDRSNLRAAHRYCNMTRDWRRHEHATAA